MENTDKKESIESIIGSRLKLRKDNMNSLLKDLNNEIGKNYKFELLNSNIQVKKHNRNPILEQNDILKSINYILQLESLEDEELYIKFSYDLNNYFNTVYDKITIEKYLNINFHLKKEIELNEKFSLMIKTNNKILALSPVIFENIISCIITNINIKNGIHEKATKEPNKYGPGAFLFLNMFGHYWNTILDLLNSDNISCLLTLFIECFKTININLSYKIIVMLFNCSFIELRNSFFIKDFNKLKWLNQLVYLPSLFKPVFKNQDFEKEIFENQFNERRIANEFIDFFVKVINISKNNENKINHYLCYYDLLNKDLNMELYKKWRRNKQDIIINDIPRDLFEIINLNLLKNPKEIDLSIIYILIEKSSLEVLLFILNCDKSFHLCKLLQNSISKNVTYIILQSISVIFNRLYLENSLIYQEYKDLFITLGHKEIIESLSNDCDNCSSVAQNIYKRHFHS